MKNLFLVALMAIIFAACQPTSYTITGTIEGVTEGKAILQNIVDGRPAPIDTAEIVEGKFTFTGTAAEPELYLIFVAENRTPIVFFGENANINITADPANMQEAEITGSEITDTYLAFVKGVPGNDRMKQMDLDYQAAMSRGDQAAMEDMKNEVNELMEEQKAYFLDFIKNNTNSVVGAHMALQAISEFSYDEFKDLVGQFETSLGESKYVADLKKALEPMAKAEEAAKATEIGAIAPDFTLETVDGEKVALSSLKGNYLLVDFWASWCKPCRAENPNVVKAYGEYASKGFDILSVSLDRDAAAWKKAIGDDGLTWTQVLDADGSVANSYGVTGIPFTLLLDKEGKIVAKNLRGPALEEKLAELLN
ncbi:TlpA disulfide reductase family protein [Labilibacter marinus]|uniref:TlpA disulfide reductase family protein n=1 Tax=Labilibacter marinus TaxID=1477105 RepID=UPI00082BB9C6|nr:TlpA disulfide reductase family protein [Labilibacter marinus]